jgi:hypothetical protein
MDPREIPPPENIEHQPLPPGYKWYAVAFCNPETGEALGMAGLPAYTEAHALSLAATSGILRVKEIDDAGWAAIRADVADRGGPPDTSPIPDAFRAAFGGEE